MNLSRPAPPAGGSAQRAILRRRILVCAALSGALLVNAPTGAAQGPPPLDTMQLRNHVAVLADDSLRGRDTPSPGLDAAARYVARRFAESGLQPFRGEGFIQHYPLATSEVIPDSVTITFPGRPPVGLGGGMVMYGDHGAPRSAEGEVVLLSGRITQASLAHQNFDGAILVIPVTASAAGLEAGRLASLANAVMSTSNPHAFLFLTDAADSIIQALSPNRWQSGRRIARDPLELRGATRASHGLFIARPEVVGSYLSGRGVDVAQVLRDTTGPFQARRLGGPPTRISVPRRLHAAELAPIVVGVVSGADPRLREESVVVSAHLDHLGVGEPAPDGDSIYNGADDNASGVAVLLAVARQLQASDRRPLRSVVFLVTSGEERGFWGSDYFAGDRAIPLDRFVAAINVDGVGRPFLGDTIAVLGGAWSTLGEAALTASRSAGVGLTPTFRPLIGYANSDHFSFARRGVPSVHLFAGGLFPYYHTPADETEVIDFPWLARVAEYAHALVREVADEPRRPVWSNPHHPRGEVPW